MTDVDGTAPIGSGPEGRRRPRRRWAVVGLAGVLAVALLAALHAPVLALVGGFLVVEDPPSRVDAIAVLLGSPDRTLEGIELYRRGYAGLLILTKGDPPTGHGDLARAGFRLLEPHELNLQAAVALGVPREAVVVLPGRAGSTRQEVVLIAEFMESRGLKSVMVVTSPSHTRRARLILRGALGDGARYAVRPSRFDGFDPRAWWRSRKQSWEVLSEYQKLLFHYALRLSEVLGLR